MIISVSLYQKTLFWGQNSAQCPQKADWWTWAGFNQSRSSQTRVGGVLAKVLKTAHFNPRGWVLRPWGSHPFCLPKNSGGLPLLREGVPLKTQKVVLLCNYSRYFDAVYGIWKYGKSDKITSFLCISNSHIVPLVGSQSREVTTLQKMCTRCFPPIYIYRGARVLQNMTSS